MIMTGVWRWEAIVWQELVEFGLLFGKRFIGVGTGFTLFVFDRSFVVYFLDRAEGAKGGALSQDKVVCNRIIYLRSYFIV